MKKKIILALFILMGCAFLTSCKGDEKTEEIQDPLVQETELGLRLEEKAKDAVETQGQDSDNADSMLDNITGE